MMSDSVDYPVESRQLYVPDRSGLGDVLRSGLQKNFGYVEVDANFDCPNLNEKPWNLASRGICGNATLIDVGGIPNLLPLPNLSKNYDLRDVARKIGMPTASLIGAGAGSLKCVGVNSEMMANVNLSDDCNDPIKTTIAKVDEKTGECALQHVDTTNFCLMANLLASQGNQGKVVKIKASKRIGEENFVSCIRNVLKDSYAKKPIGLGGVFLLKKGKANLHVMPCFSTVPLESADAVNKWLKFYECSSPLVCLSTLVSQDLGLDLRPEHTHCFSDHNQGGHYHYDTTPDDVEYEAYYVIAERMFRIDSTGGSKIAKAEISQTPKNPSN